MLGNPSKSSMYSYRVSIVLYVKPCPPGHVTPLVTWLCRPWCIALAGTGDWQLAGLVVASPAIPAPPHRRQHIHLSATQSHSLYLYISTLLLLDETSTNSQKLLLNHVLSVDFNDLSNIYCLYIYLHLQLQLLWILFLVEHSLQVWVNAPVMKTWSRSIILFCVF